MGAHTARFWGIGVRPCLRLFIPVEPFDNLGPVLGGSSCLEHPFFRLVSRELAMLIHARLMTMRTSWTRCTCPSRLRGVTEFAQSPHPDGPQVQLRCFCLRRSACIAKNLLLYLAKSCSFAVLQYGSYAAP